MNNLFERRPDLRLLETFQEVAKTGSFTKAGEKLGLTQSAVTRLIQQLEQAVDTPLLHRTTRSVQLTDAGKSMLNTAEHILKEFDFRMAKFGEQHLNKPPSVRLGFSHSIAHSHLPGLLSHFRRNHPSAILSVFHETSAQLREKLENNDIDIAVFAESPHLQKTLVQIHSFKDEFVIIAPQHEKLSADGDSRHSWLALDRGTTTGSLIATWIATLDPDATPSAEFNNFDVIVILVSLGLGSSIVPRRTLRLYGNRLPVKSIEPKESLARTVGVYLNRSATRDDTVQRFVDSILFGWKGSDKN